MLSVVNSLKNITHPLVTSLHMKKDYSAADHAKNVLVIEAHFPEADEAHSNEDAYLMDLLLDLEDLKREAEKKAGKFDRIDIRMH